MQEVSGPSARTEVSPRCVLLVGESSAVPSSLVGALDRRGMQVVIVRQPPEVMLELAPQVNAASPDKGAARQGDRSAEPQAHSGLPSSPSVEAERVAPSLSIVVVEPQQQPRISELRAAVAAYYPSVRCWQYHAHGADGHASLDVLDPSLSKPETDHSPVSRNISSPDTSQDFLDAAASKPHTSNDNKYHGPGDTARVKGANQRLRSLVVQVDDARPPDDGPLVSEEELAMLLGPDPEPSEPAEPTSP